MKQVERHNDLIYYIEYKFSSVTLTLVYLLKNWYEGVNNNNNNNNNNNDDNNNNNTWPSVN